MITKELLDYIKHQLGQRISKEQIKSELMANGWTEADVNEAFDLISTSSATAQTHHEPTPPYFTETTYAQKAKSNLVKIIMGVVTLVFLGVGIALAARIWDPLWNPFRPSPEKVISKMTEKMKEVKTLRTDLNAELDIKNELEFNLKGKFWADADNNDPKNIKSAGGADINFAMEGMQFSLGLETKQIGETSYFKLTTIPATPLIENFLTMVGIDLKELKNQWIKSDKESLKELLGEEYYEGLMKEQEEEEKKQEVMIEEFKKIIENKKFYSVKEELPDEKIGDKKTYHYTVSLDKEEIKKIIPELLNITDISESLSAARARAKEARIIADMMQMRSGAEIIYSDEGGYHKVNCDYSGKWVYMSELCKDIAEYAGNKPVIFAVNQEYCAFTPLPVKGYYYCIDSELNAVTTNINPQGTGYCNGKTFVCPAEVEILEEDYKKAADEELSKDIDKFFEKVGELSGELWIGKKDYLLYRFRGEKTFDLSQFKEGEKGTILIKLDIDLSKFNQPVKIEVPGEYKNLEEILGGMFGEYGEYLGEAQARAKDARIIADVYQLRTMAELMYSDKNSYKSLCSNFSLNENAPNYGADLAELENDIKETQGGVVDLSCYSSAESYCLEADLASSDRGRWCVDSNLVSKEIGDNESCLGNGTAANPYRCPVITGLEFPLEKKIPSYFQASILENLLKIFRK